MGMKSRQKRDDRARRSSEWHLSDALDDARRTIHRGPLDECSVALLADATAREGEHGERGYRVECGEVTASVIKVDRTFHLLTIVGTGNLTAYVDTVRNALVRAGGFSLLPPERDMPIHVRYGDGTHEDTGEDGPEGLRDWVMEHYRHFQAACRQAMGRGIATRDLVIWANPHDDSMTTPPLLVELIDRTTWEPQAGMPETVRKLIDHARANRPPAGLFDVIASRANGRFQGTFHGQLRIPDEGVSLPVGPMIAGDQANN
jgi:hypothetical protein